MQIEFCTMNQIRTQKIVVYKQYTENALNKKVQASRSFAARWCLHRDYEVRT